MATSNMYIVQGGPKKCPTFSESSGISLQIQDDISIKWGIFWSTLYKAEPSCQTVPFLEHLAFFLTQIVYQNHLIFFIYFYIIDKTNANK